MPSRPSDKQGIALVIVIGLLTVLAILALSFAVTMRTERLAARGFADSLRSREVGQAGLAEAMNAVQTDGANWYYPNWGPECILSPATSAGNTNLLFGAASNYIPTTLLATVAPQATAAPWAVLRDHNNRLIGRYAYVAVNCSGLIDANLNYGRSEVTNTDRLYGEQPSELYLDAALLSEINNAGAVGLKNERTTGPTLTRTPRRKAWMRADTLMDLGIIGRWGWTGTTPLNTTNPANVFHFSYFPLGFGEGNGTIRTANTNVTCLSGTAATLEAQRATLANQLAAAGVAQSDWTARNLIDMVDNDDVPGGVNGGGLSNSGPTPINCDNFCTEPVPMINEVSVDSVMANNGSGGYDCQIRVAVELWFPFVGATNSNNYVVQVEGRINGGQFAALTPGAVQTTAIPGPWNTSGAFKLAQITYTTSTSTNVLPTSFEIRELSVRKALNGITVDRVAPTLLTWGANGYLANFTDGAVRSSWSAKDPRQNWKTLLTASQWVERDKKAAAPGNSTLNAVNTGVGTLGEDGVTWMFAGRLGTERPITSVGDLSFLTYQEDVAWSTLKPYDTTANGGLPGLLDRFTIWLASPRGIVNANTANRNVLATVFNNVPIEAYPGQLGPAPAAGQRLASGDATAVAQAIIGNRPATGFPNLSDLSQAKAAIFGALGGLPDNYYREGVLRNSSNLLGVRQNIFTFVVVGQSVKDANNNNTVEADEVTGEAKMLVVAWRDPYLVNGRNRWFVRTLQWMDE